LFNQPNADFLTCQKQAIKADFTHRALSISVERSGTSPEEIDKAKFACGF